MLDLRRCTVGQWNGRRDDPAILHDRGGKILFRSAPLPLDFSLEGALRKTAWLADRAFGVVTTRLGHAAKVTAADFSTENCNKFLGELWDVSGFDRLSCWSEGDPRENLSTRLQAHFDRESNGSDNEYKIAIRVWPGSNQACCHAESEAR